MMITRASESCSRAPPRMGLTVGMPVRHAAVESGWLRRCLSLPDSSQGRSVLARGSDAVQSPAGCSAEFGRLEGGHDETFHPPCCALSCSDSSGGQGCKKGRLDGCLLPITLPVTVGLGENATSALNALVPVPASGGGAASLRSRLVDSYELVSVFDGCRSVEPQLIRMTLFRCSRLRTSSYLENRTCDQGRRVGGLDLHMDALVMCVG